MKNKNDRPEDDANLRRRAEEIAQKNAAQAVEHPGTLSPEETRQTLHELRVHQIELEIQNEELRRIQVELEASQSRYFDLYDLAPVGYFTVSEQGLILEANLTAATLFGMTRGDLIKRPLPYLILAEDQDIYYRHRKQLFDTGEPQVCEPRMRRENAAPFWARLDATAAKDADGMPVCRVVVIDITERKHAEEVLRAASHYSRSLLEASLDPLVTISAEGRVTDVNMATEKITGLNRERLIGSDFANYFTEPEKARAGYQKVFEMGKVIDYPLSIRHTSGTIADVLYNASVYQNEEGEVLGVFAAARDVTESNRAKWALQQAHDELEQRVRERTTELAAANEQLQSDIEERKQAQEVLRGERQTLQHLLQASDQDRQTIAYELHDELAQQLTGAIMQFQTFEALKSTKPRLAMKAHHEGMILLQRGHSETRRLIAGVRPPILDESGVVAAIGHLASERSGPPGPKIEYRKRVHFDRLNPTLENAIYRIVQEAVSNACQHSKSPKVQVSLVQRGDRVRIEIQDWGIGFDVKATPANRFGLEGIRQRARVLDGICSVQSTPGKGTTVTVELPLLESEPVHDVSPVSTALVNEAGEMYAIVTMDQPNTGDYSPQKNA